jgi:cation transport ATPase
VGHKTRNEDKQNKNKTEITKQMNNTGNKEQNKQYIDTINVGHKTRKEEKQNKNKTKKTKHLFSFLCFVFVLLVFIACLVPHVDRVSRLSILYCLCCSSV